MPCLSWSVLEPAVPPITRFFLAGSCAWACSERPPSDRAASDRARTERRRKTVFMELSRKLERKERTKRSTLVEPACRGVAHELQDLYQHHEQRYGEHHHVGLETVVAVADGQVADAAAAHHAGHRRVGEKA